MIIYTVKVRLKYNPIPKILRCCEDGCLSDFRWFQMQDGSIIEYHVSTIKSIKLSSERKALIMKRVSEHKIQESQNAIR